MNSLSNAHFRTPIHIAPDHEHIGYGQSILALGSCFADRIGNKLLTAKFNTRINPLGILYHPLAISKLLLSALQTDVSFELSWAEHTNLWHSFDLHSHFSSSDLLSLEQRIRSQQTFLEKALSESEWLILTFGTAWVFKYKANGNIVANCHKYPSSQFSKMCLSVNEITEAWNKCFDMLFQQHPGLKVILTVSPVRHIKDTLTLNSFSKAILRVSCELLAQTYPNVRYFPSYEIMMDDLRDYRFYESDLIHPSELAIQYIWEHFSHTFMSTETLKLRDSWYKIQQGINHIPHHPTLSAYRKFLLDLLKKMEVINKQLDCKEEIQLIQQRLLSFEQNSTA